MDNRTADVIHYIMHEIRSGNCPVGSRISSQMVLTRKLNCSRTTVERGIARLIAAGVLESRRGSGTFVCAQVSQFDIAEVAVITGAVDHSQRTSFVDMFLNLDTNRLPIRWMTVEAAYSNITEFRRRRSAVISYMPDPPQLMLLEELKSMNVPILIINRTFEGFDYVATDTEASLREGISWLLGKAGGSAAMVSYIPRQTRPYLAERIICAYELCMEFGISLPPERIIKRDFNLPAAECEAVIADLLFRNQKNPLAIILPNCELGAYCLNAAARCGKVCGKDFFMLSFDSIYTDGAQPAGTGALHQNYTQFQPRIEEWLRQVTSGSRQPYHALVKARLRIR